LRAAQADIIKSSEEALVKLSVAIARQVIRQEVKADPAIVRNICKAAVEQLVEKEGMVIRVNPRDMQIIQEYAQTLGKGAGLQSRVEVFSDELIKPGGCIVEANPAVSTRI
jgi:flagellar assembly protein FliH